MQFGWIWMEELRRVIDLPFFIVMDGWISSVNVEKAVVWNKL